MNHQVLLVSCFFLLLALFQSTTALDVDETTNEQNNTPLKEILVKTLPTCSWFPESKDIDMIGMRRMINNIRVFSCQLGIKNGAIPDSALSASSVEATRWPSKYGRLDRYPTNTYDGAWCSAGPRTGEWIEVDFGVLTQITGVIIQGRKDTEHGSQWTSKFSVNYLKSNGAWQYILNEEGSTKIFPGNDDRDSWVVNYFERPIEASALRMVVREYVGWSCMRFEVLGC